jgi:DNA polymerase III subunit epsilon
MTNEIVALDIATTGLSPQDDYIIQIGLTKFNSVTYELIESVSYPIRPITDNFTVAAGAYKVHHISKEDILSYTLHLDEAWKMTLEFIGDCDILSYHGNSLDIPFIYYNLLRYGIEFDFGSRNFYDAQVIQKRLYSYKLEDVYKQYTGEKFEQMPNINYTLSNTYATIEIFKHQNEKKPIVDNNDSHIFSPENFVKINDDGELVFSVGKYKGRTTNDICKNDPSYIRWVFEKFSALTKESIKDDYYKTKK